MAVAKNGTQQARGAAGSAARTAKREAGPWIERLARFGYAAKGTVYVVIGLLAMQAAQGAGSPNIDKSNVLVSIVNKPFGHILLGLLTIGFLGYAVWRLVEAASDPEREGTDHKGLIKRIGYGIAGVSYALLALAAAQLFMGSGTPSNSGNQVRDFTAQVMRYPMGRWLVVVAGLILLAVAAMEFYQAYTKRFEQHFRKGALTGEQRQWAIRLGRAGYTARGVVFTLIGAFLVQAGLQYNPQKAGGLGDAIATVAKQPYGSVLLTLLAIGLLSYGMYAFVLATYRKIYVR